MRLLESCFLSLAIAVLLAYPGAYHFAAGTASQDQAPGSASMQVDLRAAQEPISTPLGSLALVATVTSGGQPVHGAIVVFNDAHNPSFNKTGSTASTNSSGIAVASVTIFSPFPGPDTVTATATADGYGTAKGTTVVNVLPFGIQQLAVTAKVTNEGAPGGSSELIQGYAGTVDSASSNVIANVGAFWNPAITGVSGVSVTISDTIGSTFASRTVKTDGVGFYSVNFTLGEPKANVTDVVTLNASRDTYNGSESSIAFAVGPYSQNSLTVALDSLYPSTYSTILDSATIQARVSAGGAPLAGIPVSFSDSLGSLFEGQTAITDSSGTATTTVLFDSQAVGLDVFTARATENGLNSGAGSNTLPVRPNGNTQLSILVTLSPTGPLPGASERVSGKVGWVGTAMMYAWSPSQTAVSGATVVISDSLGMFAPISVSTDGSGFYSGAFTVPDTGGKADMIEATASAQGYMGSTSSVFLVAGTAQSTPGSATANGTASSSSKSVQSEPSTGASPSLPQSSTTSEAESVPTAPGVSWSFAATALVAVVSVAACAFVVSRLDKAR